MNDRVSRLVLTFDGEAGTIDQVLNGIKSSVRSAVSEIERTSSKVKLFGDIEKQVQTSAAALDAAKKKSAELTAELDKLAAAGQKATPELVKGAKDAEREVSRATTAYLKNVDALSKMQTSLTKAGVDTSNLARAQLKLAEASTAAAAAAEQQAAKQALGLKTFADVQPQIAKLNASFETLRNSGTLSSKELTIAQSQLQTKIRETYGEVTKLGVGVGGVGASLASLATSGIAKFLGVSAAIALITEGLTASVAAAKEVENAIAEIGTVTDLSREQVTGLVDGVRELATTIGFDLNSGLKSTFELLRSGVSADNVLEVLAASARAAKAAVVDVGVGAKASQVLIDAFGLSVSEIPLALDKIIRGSKDGGATLKEFAENGSALGNALRATGASFDTTLAALTVMTDKSNDAAGSAAVLTKILLRLGDSDVKLKLRELGIVSNDALEIFRQLGEQDVGIQKIIDLGVASTKTAVGVASLTNNAKELPAELEKIRDAAGEAAKDVAALYDTPRARGERFNAALHETGVQTGLLIGAQSKLAGVAADYINWVNKQTNALHTNNVEGTIFNNAITRYVTTLAGVPPVLKFVTDNLDANDRALAKMAASARASAEEMARLRKELADTSTSLVDQIKKIQAAGGGDISEINARVEQEIAGLDRTAKATADTATAKIEIERTAAADRLAIIQKTENEVLAAINTASAARVASEKRYSKENVQSQVDALTGILTLYRQQYRDLVSLAQQHAQTIGSIEQERVEFNRGVEAQIREIRSSGLSVFDQYVAKVQEVERLISEARIAGANGQIDVAKKYTEQAIALASTIKKTVAEDGRVVVGQFTAQGQAIELVKKAADAYNGALSQQETLSRKGLDSMNDALDDVIPKIKDLEGRIDGLKATLATGLEIEVRLNEESVNEALRKLNELSAPRTVTLTLNTQQGNNAGGPIGAIPYSRGGNVIEAARRFARGGPAFSRPSWNRVPGSGDGDTVPAALPVGSFVMRKSASQYYGDSLLGRLATRFAGGGLAGLFGGSNGLGLGGGPTLYQQFFNKSTSGSSFFGDIQAGTTESVRDVGQISAPKLPSDPKELLRKILQYAAEVVVAARPESQVFGKTINELNATLREYERRPDEDTLFRALQLARAIGLNIGVSNGNLKGFDVDGRRWHKEPIADVDPFHALGFSPLAASYHFFNRGGGVGGDTIPAWLTPGEWVINPPAVRAYGGGIMHAINQQLIPREQLAGLLNFSPPRVARFAEGGPVGVGVASAGADSGSASGPSPVYHLHFGDVHGDAREFVRRHVVPELNAINRRSGTKR